MEYLFHWTRDILYLGSVLVGGSGGSCGCCSGCSCGRGPGCLNVVFLDLSLLYLVEVGRGGSVSLFPGFLGASILP